MFEHAVKVYEGIYEKKFGVKRFHKLQKEMGVVAFRLGNASACAQVKIYRCCKCTGTLIRVFRVLRVISLCFPILTSCCPSCISVLLINSLG